ncbi:MAG: TetR/AcrR family transcriptional regulator [Deltaproteobacteria bacterium]|nr:MAG: TetR/AcrR family transcriptional regulator [Deltaproteobacteria bacterium]
MLTAVQASRSEPKASEVHKGDFSPPAPARGRKEETQDRIVAASLALFATRGYLGTSISAIATHARVSRAAIFWHFGDKEGLFRETFRRMLVPFFAELQASLEHIPPRERVFEILSAYERVVEENEVAIRSIVRWLLESEKLRASLRETLFALHDERGARRGARRDARRQSPARAARPERAQPRPSPRRAAAARAARDRCRR